MKRFLWIPLVAVLIAIPSAAEEGARPREFRLAGSSATASWSGAFENVAVAAPAACASGLCDEIVLDVRLPAGTWSRPGGVLVAVDRTPDAVDQLYNLDLYVYGPSGELAAASTNGPYFPSEAALIPAPANGRYRVVVVPTSVVGRLAYEGFASVEHGVPARPRRDLLPNLVARRPTKVRLETGISATPFVTFDRGVRGPTSCYAPELAEGRSRCLRFDQSVANEGSGPLELRYRDEPDGRMRQRVYRSDGSFRDRIAGEIEFHAAHAHFHYAGFMQSLLYRAREGGAKGALVRKAAKQGFCMLDFKNLRFGRRGAFPRRYDFPGVCDGSARDDEGFFTQAGISPGWADVYPWNYADQYIDVAGVPDGVYVLEIRADVDGFLEEATRSDNSASVLIELRGDAVRVRA